MEYCIGCDAHKKCSIFAGISEVGETASGWSMTEKATALFSRVCHQRVELQWRV